MDNNGNVLKEYKAGRLEYQCPVTSLPVLELEEFSNIQITKDYFFNVRKIGESIVHVQSSGDMGKSNLSKHYEFIRKFVEKAQVRLPYAEIRDFSNLTGRPSNREVKLQKQFILENEEKCAVLILCGAPFWLKAIACVGFKTYKTITKFAAANDFEQSVDAAQKVLGNLDDGRELELSFEDIIFKPEWEFFTSDQKLYVKNGIIPGNVFFSAITGDVTLERIKEIISRIETVFEAGKFENKEYYRIVDYKALEKASILARKKYAKELERINKKYSSTPSFTYICGANWKTKRMIQVASAFVKQKFIFVESVDEAFERISVPVECNMDKEDLNNRNIVVSKTDIEEISTLFGELLWDSQKEIDLEKTLATENPLCPLKETFSILKQDITELRERDKETTKGLLNLLEAVDAALVVVDKGRHEVVYANQATCKMTGFTRDEMIGKGCQRFICPSEVMRCPVTDFGEKVDEKEAYIIKSDKTQRPILKTIKEIKYDGRDCLLETIFDIEEIINVRTELEDNLKKQKDITQELTMIRNAIDVSTDAIAIATPKGRCFYQNENFAEMFGGDRNSFEYLDAFQLFTDKNAAKDIFNVLIKGGSCDIDLEVVGKDGRIIPVHLKSNSVKDDDGEVIALISIYSDITERKQSEMVLKETNQQLEKAIEAATLMARKAESANRSKSEFLANMSHEIRTPMNGVIGMSMLLLETDLTEEQKNYAECINNSGARLLDLINDILDCSKVEAGKLDLEEIDFDLRALLDDFSETMVYKAHDKALELICAASPDTPVYLRGDPGRLRQILINLVGNAIKFTEEGEISVRASLAKETKETAEVKIMVTDTGIGVPSNKLKSLFEQFTQVDGSVSRKYGGTGLGLAICKQLVELMGGEIGVNSEEGKGSEFWLSVKFKKQKSRERILLDNSKLLNAKVLVVDDNYTNRSVLYAQLSAWGVKPVKVESGLQALEIMREAQQNGDPFKVALIDSQMPEMTGEVLAKKIKEDRTIANTRLVIMPSIAQRGGAQKFTKCGFDAYLTKPLKSTDLHDCLSVLLSNEEWKNEMDFVTRHAISEIKRSDIKVLVVEDNITNQQVVSRMLKKRGVVADVAQNGEEAINAVEKNEYDIVLMDCQMPEMDGFVSTKIIRLSGSEKVSKVPIIALTANAMKGDMEKCIEAGMDDYLAKPIGKNALIDTINKWLPDEKKWSDSEQEVSAAKEITERENVKSKMAVINIEKLSENFDDDMDLVKAILARYLQDAEKQMEELWHCIEENNLVKIKDQTHKMKGAVVAVGGEVFADLLAKAELAAKNNNNEELKLLLQEVGPEFEKLKQEVGRVVSS